MKKLIVLAVASLIATSANAAEMKWFGSTGWRYSQTKHDDNLNNKISGKDTSSLKTKSHQVRGNVGATGGWENVEWGVGMRLRNGTTANDDYVTVQQNQDPTVGMEQAWFRYLRDFGSMDFSVTVGRQKNVLAYDSVSQNLFDNDVRWDGFGWQFKFGMFGLNAAQYILGSTSGASSYTKTEANELGRKFNYLMAFQPYMNWKFTDEIETMFAVGYYLWSDASHTNTIGGGVSNTWNTTAGGSTATALNTGNTLQVHNPRQWHFLNTWTLPYNLFFNGELVMNKETRYNDANVSGNYTGGTTQPEASGTAWTLGLTYGALKKAQDFSIGYAYGSKGVASVINAYSNESFLADNKGHRITAGYSVADNFNLGFDLYFLEEKERLNPLTGVAYTGANAGQKLNTTYWELTAGVMF